MTIHVPIKDAKNRLSELVRCMEGGERVIITRRGQEVAELGPPPARKVGADFEALRRWKAERGIVRVTGPMASNFDDPLPEDFLSTPLT